MKKTAKQQTQRQSPPNKQNSKKSKVERPKEITIDEGEEEEEEEAGDYFYDIKKDYMKIPRHNDGCTDFDLIEKVAKIGKRIVKQSNYYSLFSEGILTKLEEKKLITKKPLKWVKFPSLCAYFIDNFLSDDEHDDKWKVGEFVFKIKNLAVHKYNYSCNTTTNGRPKRHKMIDDILSAYQRE